MGTSAMHRVILSLIGATVLTGCTDTDARLQAIGAEWNAIDLSAETRRTFEWSYYDQAFGDGDGAVTVLTAEYGRLKGYTLVPCRGGNAVCAGSPSGRAGTVTRTPDYDVVTGTYANRTFYLAPGGDGYMRRGTDVIPLAWD